jgi:hypothetical protein
MGATYRPDNPFAPRAVASPAPAPARRTYRADNPFARRDATAVTPAPAEPPHPFAEDAAGTARAVGQGASFGFGEEIEAGVRAPFEDRTYPQIRDDIRAQQAKFTERHQFIAAGAEIAGGLATAAVPLGGTARAATALGRIGRATKVGVATGALYGFGKGEGDVAAQAKSAATGAGMGLLFGAGMQGAAEAGRVAMRATSAAPRAANALATVAPVPRIRQWAAGVQARAEDALVRERLTQDGRTLDDVRRFATDAPEHIPVAVVDAGGENTRQQLAALKRIPGPQKEAITQTVAARDANAPGWMDRSLRDNGENVAAALGLDPKKVDTRTMNPNDVLKLAREALSERSSARYGPSMDRPGVEHPEALATFAGLLQRPSIRRAMRTGQSLAAESGEHVPMRTLTESAPIFDEAGNMVAPEITLPGRASADPVMSTTRTVGRGAKPPVERPVAKPGTKLAQAIDDAHAGEDVMPPSGGAAQGKFYGALDNDALSRQWLRETKRLMRENEAHAAGNWVRIQDDGSVVSGGSTSGGRAKKQGQFTRGRIERIETELRTRGFDDDAINGLWSDQALAAGGPRVTTTTPDAPFDGRDYLREPGAGADVNVTPASRRVPAPTVRQLHYTKMGLDEQITALEARQAALRAQGAKGGTTNTRLAKLYKTRGKLLDVIDGVAPDYAAAMRAHAAEAAPIDAFQQGRRVAPSTLPDEVATKLDGMRNDNARTAFGGGQSRRLRADVRRAQSRNGDPTKPVVGSGADDDETVRNLRQTQPAAAPAIERDAATIQRIRTTNKAVTQNSATAERQQEDAATMKKIGAVANLMTGKPIAFVRDVLGGTYGRTAEGAARKLLLGAKPGERDELLRYLGQLEQQSGPRGRLPRLRARGVGTVAGLAGGSAGAAVTRP